MEVFSMFIQDNVFNSRGIHFVASPRGKLNSSELHRFRSLITRKKRAVMSRERNDRTEVQTTSSDRSDPCRRRREIKRTVSLSPVIPSASTCSAATSCLHYFLSPRPSLPGHSTSWIVLFSESHPSFSFVTRSFVLALPLFRHMCFLLFFTRITIQASAFIAYSILACKIIYIYIRLNLVLKSKFIVPPRTLPISNMAHFTYCILI